MSKSEKECDEIIETVSKHFKVKRLSGATFLGISIVRDHEGIFLHQQRYIEDVSARFNLSDCKQLPTPLADIKPLLNEENEEIHMNRYQEAIGCLLYLHTPAA